MTGMQVLEVLGKLLLTVVLGGIVGWQRESRERPAGLRTHVLVCLGSAIYTLAGMSFVGAEPSRVAAQVASGIGFLGAGTIIRHGSEVRGLTTAASLWAVAAIGICIGLGGPSLWTALLGTGVVMLTLTVLHRLEGRIVTRTRHALMTLRISGDADRLPEVQRVLAEKNIHIESMHMVESALGEGQELQLGVRLPETMDLSGVMASLSALGGFHSLRCD
jgi:putative Mg2+ transporter-C (MgtC) family protein